MTYVTRPQKTLRAAKKVRPKLGTDLRVIPAKGDLLILGPPTLSVAGMSLSQALEEQREERL